MNTSVKNILKEEVKDSQRRPTIEDIQNIIDKVYPHIVTNLGPSPYNEEIPPVEIWNDIYARYSGIPEMRGEASKKTKAEWVYEDNTIYVYHLNMVDIEDIIRSLLHEYTHSLQDEEKREENRQQGYENDPDEIGAHAAEEDWEDYLIYLQDNPKKNIVEQKEKNSNGFTPQLINVLKYIFTIYGDTQTDGNKFSARMQDLFAVHADEFNLLYLTLVYNQKSHGWGSLEEMVNNLEPNEYEITPIYEYYLEYKDEYTSYDEEEACEDGYGEHSGEECECEEFEAIVVEDENGDEERIPCDDADEDQLKSIGWDEDDCECEEYKYKEIEWFYYNEVRKDILTYVDLRYEEGVENLRDEYYTWDAIEGELYGEGHVITYEDTESRDDERQTWEYFSDNEGGETNEFFMDGEYGTEDIRGSIQYVSNIITRKKALNEQDEQISLFPYGEWEFPVGWDPDDDYISELKYNVPENLFAKIFEIWDKNGIDFSVFKLLGIQPDTVTSTYVLKRYIQNTTKPIPVSYTFNCNDLAELFDTDHRDYDMGYVKDYLCGEDSFWDSQDWYNYDWDDYMSDQIDEKNWKTISEIFGGVSQSVAEDILNRSSSSEEVDELTEKYEEEIDEIRSFTVWAHNDEHEWAIKNAMAEDIKDKIAGHFQTDGHLHTDNKGSKSWTIEGDLRDYINDQWDNTDTYQFHPDYSSSPIEDWLLDMTITNNITDYIFGSLMEEEYRFWDYCEGKQGECLEPDTRFFDGYWHPNYDINESLADRLGELTYEPTITTPEGETKPLDEAQEDRKTGEDLERNLSDVEGYSENTPFTSTEIKILNLLVKRFTKSELQSITELDETQIGHELKRKWRDIIKLFGESSDTDEAWAKSTRYGKWVLDNWNEAQAEDFDDDTIDFGRVSTPEKAWPSMFEVLGVESGWEQTWRSGYITIPAWDKEDAEERAHDSWWDYEPDMDTTDYGDWESDNFEIDDVTHNEILKEGPITPIETKEESPDLEIGDRIMVWDLTPDPSPPGGYYEYPDGAIPIPRTLIGTVTDSLDDDEIDLESFRGGIKYMVRDDSTGEEYGLYRGADGYSEPYLDRDKWIKLPKKTLTEIKNNVDYYMRLSENVYPFMVNKLKNSNTLTPKQLDEYITLYKESCNVNNKFLIINREKLVDNLESEGIKIEFPLIKEHGVTPNNEEESSTNIPDWMTKFLVTAFFFHSGGWGVTPKRFKIFMKPNGQIVKTDLGTGATPLDIPEQFRVGKTVTFGDLLNFENNSKWDLRMKGRLRESYIDPNKTRLTEIFPSKIEMTPQKNYYLKRILKEQQEDNIAQLLRLAQDTKKGWMAGPGRKKVFEYLNKVRESGLINMYQSPDFLISGSLWLRKYIDLHHPEALEPIDEYEDSDIDIRHKETIQYLLDNADSTRDVIIANVLAKSEEQGITDIKRQSAMMRGSAADMFKLWAQYFAN
jgi:hypothetical protein